MQRFLIAVTLALGVTLGACAESKASGFGGFSYGLCVNYSYSCWHTRGHGQQCIPPCDYAAPMMYGGSANLPSHPWASTGPFGPTSNGHQGYGGAGQGWYGGPGYGGYGY